MTSWTGNKQLEGTLEQVLFDAGLNYEVEKLPNIHRFPDGTEITSDTSFFTYRTDTKEVLGDRLGKVYEVVQNSQAFAIVKSLIECCGAEIDTASISGGGARCWVSVKTNERFQVGPNEDEVVMYMLIVNSHDGSGNVGIYFTPVRLWCSNALHAAIGSAMMKWSIRHTVSAATRLQDAEAAYERMQKVVPQLQEHFDAMLGTELGNHDFFEYAVNVLATDKQMEAIQNREKGVEISECLSGTKLEQLQEIMHYAESGPGQTVARTAWWAFNAITGWLSHVNMQDNDNKALDLWTNSTTSRIAAKAAKLAMDWSLVKSL